MVPDPATVQALFLEIFELPPEEREWRLIAVTSGKPELRAAVEKLLGHHDEPSQLVQRMDSAAERAPQPQRPEQIGRYRIQDILGSGGAGIVYRAEQEGRQRVVALKVLASQFLAKDAARRLRREAEFLSALRHDGIAKVYDVGSFDDGFGEKPYFAMELVEGAPLTEWAVNRGASVRERVELLAEVCEAVDHAHRQRIVHRDLKPANILVQEIEGVGHPKVLDFGVARIMGESAEWEANRTRTGQLVGTLAYMSPEQIGGPSRQLDARSDIYSLGVLAYELLAGERPFAGAGRALTELTRRIMEDDPEPLGQRNVELAGDLEAIVAQAMQKRAEARYDTAAALAADFRAHLAGDPVAAPKSRGLWSALRSVWRGQR